MGRDGSGAVASEGRLVENPLLNAAASGRRSAGVKKAAALFDTTSLWAIGMLRRYAVSIIGYLSACSDWLLTILQAGCTVACASTFVGLRLLGV